MPLVCLFDHRVGGEQSWGADKDDCMSGHAFSRNLWLVSEKVASCYADIGVASNEAGKK